MSVKDELRRQLGVKKAGPMIGKVIEVLTDSVRVQTALGTVHVQRPPGLQLVAGNEVLFANGVVLGRVKDSADVPVYFV